MAHHGFHAGIALVLLTYSIEEGTTEIEWPSGTIQKTRWQGVGRDSYRKGMGLHGYH